MALELNPECFEGCLNKVIMDAKPLLEKGWRIPTKEDMAIIRNSSLRTEYASTPQGPITWWWTCTTSYGAGSSFYRTNREALQDTSTWIANLTSECYEGHWDNVLSVPRYLRLVRDV